MGSLDFIDSWEDEDGVLDDQEQAAVQAYWDELLGPDEEALYDDDEDEVDEYDRTHEFVALKWATDGVTSLEEAADQLHALASQFESWASEGYTLEDAVYDGHYNILKPQHAIEAELLEQKGEADY